MPQSTVKSLAHWMLGLGLFLLIPYHSPAQLCNGAGNVVVFSNYDGSGNTAATRLNINVDVNIPNLKIGIASYERVTVNIAGTQVSCVTAVRWAGYGASNNHCTSTAATVITGVAPGIITYVTSPPSTVSDPLGNANIIGGYACTLPNGTGNGGGSASMYQMVNYFLSAFGPGSTLRSAFSQYGCWAGTTKTISAAASGNCCPLTPVLPVALISFDKSCENQQTALHWRTGAELNAGSFTVERSMHGSDFQPVAEVNGSGKTDDISSYDWVDPAPSAPGDHYRLINTDINGGKQVLGTIEAGNCGMDQAELRILGHPVESALILQYVLQADADVVLEVSDPFGKSILSETKHGSTGANVFMLDVSGLSSGVYLLNLLDGGRNIHRKFIKY